MEKCLQEHFIRAWDANTHRSILTMVIAMLSLAKLRLQLASLHVCMTGDASDELLALLQCLSMSMEPTCAFHSLHKYGETVVPRVCIDAVLMQG